MNFKELVDSIDDSDLLAISLLLAAQNAVFSNNPEGRVINLSSVQKSNQVLDFYILLSPNDQMEMMSYLHEKTQKYRETAKNKNEFIAPLRQSRPLIEDGAAFDPQVIEVFQDSRKKLTDRFSDLSIQVIQEMDKIVIDCEQRSATTSFLIVALMSRSEFLPFDFLQRSRSKIMAEDFKSIQEEFLKVNRLGRFSVGIICYAPRLLMIADRARQIAENRNQALVQPLDLLEGVLLESKQWVLSFLQKLGLDANTLLNEIKNFK